MTRFSIRRGLTHSPLAAVLFASTVTAPLAAQQPSDANTAIALDQALGDLATLEKRWNDLTPAQRKDRTDLRAALASMLMSSGRADAALAHLRVLAAQDGDGRNAIWAREVITRVYDPQARQQGRSEDALRALIRQLDLGGGDDPKVDAAFRQIDSLGRLANPALLDLLDELGPFGVQHAVQLLVAHWEPAVATTLTQAMRNDADHALQHAVAQSLTDMPAAAAAPLALDALVHADPSIRRVAARALTLHGDADQVARARDVLVRLATTDGDALPKTRDLAVEALTSTRLAGDARVEALLDSIARDAGHPGNRTALIALIDRCPDTTAGEDRMLAVLADLDPARHIEVFLRLEDHRSNWPRIAAMALRDPRVGLSDAQDLLFQVDWTAAPSDAVAALSRFAADQSNGRGERAATITTTHADRQIDLLDPYLAVQPQAAGFRVAFAWLNARQPQYLRTWIESLTADEFRVYGDVIASYYTQHGTADDVPNMTRVGLMGKFSPRGHNEYALLDRLLDQVDGRHFVTMLDAVGIPQSYLNVHAFWGQRTQRVVRHIERAGVPAVAIEAALARALEIDGSCAGAIIQAMHRHGDTAVPALSAAIERLVTAGDIVDYSVEQAWTQPMPRQILLGKLLSTLGAIGTADAGAALRPLIDRIPSSHRELAIREYLRCADRERIARLPGLLDTAKPNELDVVLQAPEVASEAELRTRAMERLRSLPIDAKMSPQRFLRALPEMARQKLLIELIEAPEFVERERYYSATLLRELGEFKSADLASTLAKGLAHEVSSVREEAVSQLGRTFDQRAAPYLISALTDDSRDIAKRAEQALERIKGYLQTKSYWIDEFDLDRDAAGKDKRDNR